MAQDPVCGMDVDPYTAPFSTSRNGQTHYFCSKACKEKFSLNQSNLQKKKSVFTRFLEWIARANKNRFRDEPPSCCNHK